MTQEESKISVEVSDGEVMLDAHLPPADVVDRCDTTLKVCRYIPSLTQGIKGKV